MRKKIAPIKTTIVGGLVFLVPCIIIIAIVGKAFEVMGLIAAPFSAWIPVDSIGGIATANVITVLAILIVCYLAGHVARSRSGKSMYQSLDDKMLTLFPRYSFIKSMTAGMSEDASSTALQPVRVNLDDQSQVAFEIERNEEGLVVLYIPGSPDPWSGAVIHVSAERVEPVSASFNDVVNSLRKVGRGAGSLFD